MPYVLCAQTPFSIASNRLAVLAKGTLHVRLAAWGVRDVGCFFLIQLWVRAVVALSILPYQDVTEGKNTRERDN